MLGLFGAGLWAFALRASPAERARHLRTVAASLVAARDLAGAERLLVRSLDDDPDDAESLALLGEILLELGRADEALAPLYSALVRSPDHARAHAALARIHLTRGEPDLALSHALAAGATKGAPADAHLVVAAVRAQRSDVRGMLEALEAAAAASPGDVSSILTAAHVAELIGRSTWDDAMAERARAHFESAAVRAARAGDAASQARALLALGRHASALAALDAARTGRATHPADVDAILRSQALLAGGDVESAEETLREALAAGSTAELAAALVDLLVRDGRLDEAGAVSEAAAREFGDVQPRLLLADLGRAGAAHRAAASAAVLPLALERVRGSANPLEPVLSAALKGAVADSTARRVRLGLAAPAVVAAVGTSAEDAASVTRIEDDVRALLAEDPRDAVALVWQAALALQRGAPDAALDVLRDAGDLREALHVRAAAFARLGRWDESAAAAAASMRGGAATPARTALLVRALTRVGRAEAAATLGRRAVLDWPGDADLAQSLLDAVGARASESAALTARLQLLRGDATAAAAGALGLLRETPGDAGARSILTGAWSAAAAACARRVAADPQDERARIEWALCLERAGRPRRGVAVLREQEPAGSERRIVLAGVLARHGGAAEAESILLAVLAQEPGSADARLELASLRASAGLDDEAAALRRAVLAGPAPDEAARRAITGLLARESPRDDDIAAAERWLAAHAQEPAGAPLDGLVHLVRGRLDEALSSARTATFRSPQSVLPRLVAAQANLRAGRLAEGEKDLAVAVLLAPEDDALRAHLARVRARLGAQALARGEHAAARDFLEQAVVGGPAQIGGSDAATAAVLVLAQAHLRGADRAWTQAFQRIEGAKPRSAAGPLFAGHVLLGLRRHADAAAQFREAAARAPGEVAPLAGLVDTASAAPGADGNFLASETAKLLRRALAEDDAPAVLHHLLGAALLRMGDAAGAVDALREAVRLAPDDLDASLLLVVALRRAGREGEVRAVVDDAVRAHERPEAGEAAAFARLLLAAGDAQAATERLSAAVGAAPGAAPASFLLGRILAETGDPQAAARHFDAAATADPFQVAPWFQLVTALRRAGRVPEARARLERAVADHPGSAAAWCVLGTLAQDARAFDEAASHYRRALALAPHLELARNNLAWVVGEELGQPAEALEILAPALVVLGGDPDVADTHARLLFRAKRFPDALAAADRAAAARPNAAASHWRRAEILRALAWDTQELAALARVEEIDPAFAAARGVPARSAELRTKLAR